MADLNARDINDAWLRALAQYNTFIDDFAKNVMGQDAAIAIGMAFENAQKLPGLAEIWQQQDPESYQKAALIAGHKEV